MYIVTILLLINSQQTVVPVGRNFSLLIRVNSKAWSRASIGSSPTGRCSDLDKVPWRDLTLLDKHDIPSLTGACMADFDGGMKMNAWIAIASDRMGETCELQILYVD